MPVAVLIGVAGFSVSGCGSPERDEVATMYVEAAADDGFEVEHRCVRRVLGAMSDRDLTALADAGLDGSAELSENGLAVLGDVANQCADLDQYISVLMTDLANDPQLDPDADLGCIERQLRSLTSLDEVDRELPTIVVGCTNRA